MVSEHSDKSRKQARYVPSPTGLLRESTTCVEKQLVSDSTSKLTEKIRARTDERSEGVGEDNDGARHTLILASLLQ